MLIDTHCHLTMYDDGPERSGVIEAATEAGISRLITIGTDIEDSRQAISIAEKHDFIFTAVGIHPHDVKDFSDGELVSAKIRELASHNKVVALGETGLDGLGQLPSA